MDRNLQVLTFFFFLFHGSKNRSTEPTADCSCPFKNAKWSNHVVSSLKKLSVTDTKRYSWAILRNISRSSCTCIPSYISKARTVLQAMIAWESGVRVIMIPAPLILLLQPGLDPLKGGMCLINHLILMSGQWSPYPSLTVPLWMSKEGFSSSAEKWKNGRLN